MARGTLTLPLGLGLIAVAVALSLALGARPVALGDVWEALAGRGTPAMHELVWDFRVPRTVLAVLVGTALAVAGVLMQSVTRNPIAEPGILGVSQGAALGVAIAIAYLGVNTVVGYVWFAILGAMLASLIVFALAGAVGGGNSPLRLVLAGAALNAFLAAAVALILTVKGRTLEGYRFWQVGQLIDRPISVSLTLLPFLIVGLVLALSVARGLDSLALGDDVAQSQGHRVGPVRLVAALAATLLTAAGVAGAGPIAFVGLVVPHLARWVVGSTHWRLIPAAAIGGIVLVLGADVLGRLLYRPGEVPVAVMCALIGVPFLIVLVRRRVVAT